MIRPLLSALLRAIATLFLTLTFTFVILRLAGDPLQALLPPDTPAIIIEMKRVEWGLDQPLHVQFFSYIGHILVGDFGISLENGQSALKLVLAKVPATLELMGTALLVATLLGSLLGVLAALRRGTLFDRLVMTFAVLMHSMPGFLIAILLIQLFAVALRWLPSGGGSTPSHLVMPALVVGLANAGAIARFVRSSVLEILGQKHVLAARARRLDMPAVIFRHVLPNASLPVLTLLGFLVGGMIGGAAIVETVYAWPGVGRFMVAAVGRRDLAVVQTIVILVSVTMIIANLVIDVLVVTIDPRLRKRAA